MIHLKGCQIFLKDMKKKSIARLKRSLYGLGNLQVSTRIVHKSMILFINYLILVGNESNRFNNISAYRHFSINTPWGPLPWKGVNSKYRQLGVRSQPLKLKMKKERRKKEEESRRSIYVWIFRHLPWFRNI